MALSKEQKIYCSVLLDFKAYRILSDFLQRCAINVEPIAQLLELAQAILKVDTVTINQLAPRLGYGDFTKLELLDQKIYCYFQTLTVQYEREEWMDYLRGITPILVDVLRQLIKRDFLPDLESYLVPIEKPTQLGHQIYRGVQWSREMIEAQPNVIHDTWVKYYGKHFDYGHYVSSSHLLKLIEVNSQHTEVRKKAEQMRQIEKLARNLAAHEVVFIDETWFMERVKMKPQAIHYLLIELIHLAGLNQDKHWQILTHINSNIKEILTNMA